MKYGHGVTYLGIVSLRSKGPAIHFAKCIAVAKLILAVLTRLPDHQSCSG